MFQSKKNKLIPAGDYVTEEEAITDSLTDLKYRCETVTDVVRNKIFSLSQALKAYDVSLEEYLGYLMLKREKLISVDTELMAALMSAFLGAMDLSHANLDIRTKKVVADMRELSAVK